MSFDSFPEEILLNIFSHLSVKDRVIVQRVCKTWQRLSLSGVKYIKFRGCRWVTDELRKEYKDCRVLAVCSWSQVNGVLRNCKELASVKFHGCIRGKDAFSETFGLISRCKKLGLYLGYACDRLLNMVNKHLLQVDEFTICCELATGSVSDEFNCFLRRNKNLKILRINWTPLSFDFKLIPTTCELRIQSRDEHPSALFKSLLVSSGQTLQKLDLSGGRKSGYKISVSKECCLCISRFLHLKELRINVCYDNFRNLWLETLERLKINFTEPFDVDRSHLLSFLKSNPKLTALNLSFYYGQHNVIENLYDCCPCVRHLYLRDFRCFNNKHLQSLLQFPKLESLSLNTVNATGKQVVAFVSDSKSLRSLDVGYYGSRDERDSIQIWNGFVEKARHNPSQRYYLHIGRFDNYPKSGAPRNLFWFSKRKSNDHRELSEYDWHCLVRKPALESSAVFDFF